MAVKSVAIGIRNINTKSGLGKIVLEQIKYYLANNISVDIYTSKYDTVAKESGVNIIKIPKIPLLNEYYQRLTFAKIAQSKILKKNYDLIIGHGDLIQQDILFLHNLVETAYHMTHKKEMQPLNHIAKIRRLILHKQDFKLLIANSNLMKNILINQFNIPDKKIQVLYPAYNPQQFNNLEHKNIRTKMRQQLGINNDVALIGFITSGDFKKRALPLFIEALNLLPKDIEYKVLVVGKDKNYQSYIQKAKEYNIENKFIHKEPIEDVQNYFHCVDFDVHCAYFEEFGMVIEEAMACGTPVITSKMVGASEIMCDSSMVMKEPNTKELAQMIERLLRDKHLRENLSEAALKSVHDRDWQHYIESFVSLTLKI